ncbi:hypothetical protein HPB48_026602 [Haemaphysalis longicornis]|uniref:Uncharacterized protein n=1 Tax=Haemaphysalis longicornis TaxID=44386 RepID=A0A9J6HBV3_HAELO|nr:hypothetical protein HPB48_026602 [Haemaphysalis longicornis]
MIRNSEEVIDTLKCNEKESLSAFSVDIKDLFYSLPHAGILCCVEDDIDRYGDVAFQNASEISVAGFLEV